MSLAPEDLPERVEAWAAIDRIVWQDVDAEPADARRSCAALRGWVAGGGRLVIAGGTAGPEDARRRSRTRCCPTGRASRPTSPAASLGGILGQLPADRDDAARPVRRARSRAGRSPRSATASSPRNGRTAPARVTLLGFDPTVDWIAKTDSSPRACGAACCRRAPAAASAIFDDNLLVGAASPGADASRCRRSAA